MPSSPWWSRTMKPWEGTGGENSGKIPEQVGKIPLPSPIPGALPKPCEFPPWEAGATFLGCFARNSGGKLRRWRVGNTQGVLVWGWILWILGRDLGSAAKVIPKTPECREGRRERSLRFPSSRCSRCLPFQGFPVDRGAPAGGGTRGFQGFQGFPAPCGAGELLGKGKNRGRDLFLGLEAGTVLPAPGRILFPSVEPRLELLLGWNPSELEFGAVPAPECP